MSLRIATLAALAGLAFTGAAMADSLGNMSQAVGDSADASARIVAAGGQVALGAVAIPLAGIGGLSEATGSAATHISNDLWSAANAPLKIEDTVVMAQPAPRVPQLPVPRPAPEPVR